MFSLVVVAALFVAGFVFDLAAGELTLGDSVLQWSFATVALAAFWFVRREARLRHELLDFLRRNQSAVSDGTARFRGQPVTYATRVRSYDAVLSLLIMSWKLPSRFTLDRGEARRVHVACSLISCVFGWWGIPWGPIWTARAITGNARGAKELAVGELFEGKSDVKLPPARVTS